MARVVKLEFHDEAANSHKYYEIAFGSSMSDVAEVRWGRIGSSGQSQTIDMPAANKKLHEKQAKGYRIVMDTEFKSKKNDPFSKIKSNGKPKKKSDPDEMDLISAIEELNRVLG